MRTLEKHCRRRGFCILQLVAFSSSSLLHCSQLLCDWAFAGPVASSTSQQLCHSTDQGQFHRGLPPMIAGLTACLPAGPHTIDSYSNARLLQLKAKFKVYYSDKFSGIIYWPFVTNDLIEFYKNKWKLMLLCVYIWSYFCSINLKIL